MDPRIRAHAELLVDHCTSVTAGENVLISAPTGAEALVVALYGCIGERDARPMTTWRNPRASREYLRRVDPEEVRTSEHERAAMAESDVAILIKGSRNASAGSDVPGETRTAAGRARQPVLAERLDTRWVITQHPTAADAQRAGMSTAAWTDYVYEATLADWEDRRRRQRRIADVLEAGSELRLVKGEATDLRFSIEGMGAYNDDGTENMPGGEVATVPVVDSVEGTVAFDLPALRHGREVEGAWLSFEEGEVVEYGAARNEEVLTAVLETDPGARRAGEFGIGTNEGIDRLCGNVLFDEKARNTVHLALGAAVEACVPDGEEVNESAVHFDLLLDASEDSVVDVDGETIQRDGRFWFEEGF